MYFDRGRGGVRVRSRWDPTPPPGGGVIIKKNFILHPVILHAAEISPELLVLVSTIQEFSPENMWKKFSGASRRIFSKKTCEIFFRRFAPGILPELLVLVSQKGMQDNGMQDKNL